MAALNFEDAGVHFSAALKAGVSLPALSRAAILRLRAECFFRGSPPMRPPAPQCLEEAIAILIKEDSSDLLVSQCLAACWELKAGIFHTAGRTTEAADAYEQTIALYRRNGDHILEAVALDRAATNLETSGEHEKGLRYLDRAETLFRGAREGGDDDLGDRITNSRRRLLCKLGRIAECLAHCQASMTNATRRHGRHNLQAATVLLCQAL